MSALARLTAFGTSQDHLLPLFFDIVRVKLEKRVGPHEKGWTFALSLSLIALGEQDQSKKGSLRLSLK